MRLKWSGYALGNYTAETQDVDIKRQYRVRGEKQNWWVNLTITQGRVINKTVYQVEAVKTHNLGWAPTWGMGMERCQILEDWYRR